QSRLCWPGARQNGDKDTEQRLRLYCRRRRRFRRMRRGGKTCACAARQWQSGPAAVRLASQSAPICGNISPLASEMASINTASENLAQVSAPIISFHIVLPKSCLLTGPTPRHPGKGHPHLAQKLGCKDGCANPSSRGETLLHCHRDRAHDFSHALLALGD